MFTSTLQTNSIGCQYISRSRNYMSRVRDATPKAFSAIISKIFTLHAIKSNLWNWLALWRNLDKADLTSSQVPPVWSLVRSWDETRRASGANEREVGAREEHRRRRIRCDSGTYKHLLPWNIFHWCLRGAHLCRSGSYDRVEGKLVPRKSAGS